MPQTASRIRRIVRLVLTLAALPLVGCGGGGEVQILSVDPRVGALQGEQPVRIGGKNFRSDIGYTVYFGNQKALQVTILDENTLLAVTPSRDSAGPVDITIRADDGPAFRIAGGYEYTDMGGNVVEQLGDTPGQTGQGNLAY